MSSIKIAVGHPSVEFSTIAKCPGYQLANFKHKHIVLEMNPDDDIVRTVELRVHAPEETVDYLPLCMPAILAPLSEQSMLKMVSHQPTSDFYTWIREVVRDLQELHPDNPASVDIDIYPEDPSVLVMVFHYTSVGLHIPRTTLENFQLLSPTDTNLTALGLDPEKLQAWVEWATTGTDVSC